MYRHKFQKWIPETAKCKPLQHFTKQIGGNWSLQNRIQSYKQINSPTGICLILKSDWTVNVGGRSASACIHADPTVLQGFTVTCQSVIRGFEMMRRGLVCQRFVCDSAGSSSVPVAARRSVRETLGTKRSLHVSFSQQKKKKKKPIYIQLQQLTVTVDV